MGRLLVIAIAVFWIGAALRGTRDQAFHTVSDRVGTTAQVPAPVTMPTVAYRPGEPTLLPGESTTLTRQSDGHFYADATVNGQPVSMLVDTGASTVALTLDDARRLGLAADPASFAVVGMGASGPIRGARVTLADVALGGRHVGPLDAVVLEGLDRSLLGQAYLAHLDQVRIEGETMTLR